MFSVFRDPRHRSRRKKASSRAKSWRRSPKSTSPRSRNTTSSPMPRRTERRSSSTSRRRAIISTSIPEDTVLTLYFTLPLKTPVKAKDLTLEVYDREFFVDFSFAEKNPVKLVGAPAHCKLSVGRPQEMRRRTDATAEPTRRRSARSLADHRGRIRQQDRSEMSVKSPSSGDRIVHIALLVTVIAGLLFDRPACSTAHSPRPARSARLGASAGRRRGRRARLDLRQAGGILSPVFEPAPRRQGRRQRRLEPVRIVVPLRHFSRRRPRSRQGGDLVLHRRE